MCAFFIRFSAAAKYSGAISNPINLRPNSIAATPVEPTPINGSNMTSFSLLAIVINFFNIATGFCVGCFGSLNLSGFMHILLSMKLCISA